MGKPPPRAAENKEVGVGDPPSLAQSWWGEVLWPRPPPPLPHWHRPLSGTASASLSPLEEWDVPFPPVLPALLGFQKFREGRRGLRNKRRVRDRAVSWPQRESESPPISLLQASQLPHPYPPNLAGDVGYKGYFVAFGSSQQPLPAGLAPVFLWVKPLTTVPPTQSRPSPRRGAGNASGHDQMGRKERADRGQPRSLGSVCSAWGQGLCPGLGGVEVGDGEELLTAWHQGPPGMCVEGAEWP